MVGLADRDKGRRREKRIEQENRNGANGYKDAISVVWSIAITSVPSFRRSVTGRLATATPKHYFDRAEWPEANGGGHTGMRDERDRERERERERGLNGYILISFVHPQKLLSMPLHCSRGSFSGWYRFGKKRHFATRKHRLQIPSCRIPRANPLRNANTCDHRFGKSP